MPEDTRRAVNSLRSVDEIQKAHDVLVAYALGEVRGVVIGDDTRIAMQAGLDVLCWVLQHDHNPAFGDFFGALLKAAEQAGGQFRRATH